mgnify:CR=1 FL=1
MRDVPEAGVPLSNATVNETEDQTQTLEPAPVDPTTAPTFVELGTDPQIAEALAADGITHAFPIQAQCIPLALEGRDLIGQAKTGTGKTLGFGIPLLQRIAIPGSEEYAALDPALQGKPQALVVCPTRELGLQVATDIQRAGRIMGARVLAIYGGRAYEPQIDALQKGIDVVVGTPGRVIDLYEQTSRQIRLTHQLDRGSDFERCTYDNL